MVSARDFIVRRQANRLVVRAGRGGQLVSLSPQQFNEAVQLAGTGDSLAFFGRSRNVARFGGFILAEARRRSGIVSKDALLRELGKKRRQSLDPRQFTIGRLEIETGRFSKDALIRIIENSQRQSLPGLRGLSKQEVVNVAVGRRSIPPASFRPQQLRRITPQARERKTIRQRLEEQSMRLSRRQETLKRGFPRRTFTPAIPLTRKGIKQTQINVLVLAQKLVDAGLGILTIPSALKRIKEDPAIVKKIPGAIIGGTKKFGVFAVESPTEAIVSIGGEVVLLGGTSSAINKLSKLTRVGFARASTKFVGKAQVGKVLKINVGEGKTVPLTVVKKIPKETIKSQLAKEGTSLNAISSQADKLLGTLKTTREIKKPLGVVRKGVQKGKPIETVLSSTGKKLLGKLDKGTITRRESIVLDRLIRQKGGKGILERAFFADPTGKIRPSRLGLVGEEGFSFKDILAGRVTFRRPKPQILLFPDTRIQKLPEALKKVRQKLIDGKQLTKEESAKLLAFQLKKSGKFKPLGFVTKESEVTLAPGEVIKRVKKVGVTIINGEPVPIVKAEIFKVKGKAKVLLDKFQKPGAKRLLTKKEKLLAKKKTKSLKELKKIRDKGKITPKEIKTLNRLLKKQTGIDFKLSSIARKKKFISPTKLSSTVLSRSFPKLKVSVRRSSKPSPRVSVRPSRKISRRVSGKPSSRKLSRPSSKPTSRPSSRPFSRPSLKSPLRRSSTGRFLPRASPRPRPTGRPIRPISAREVRKRRARKEDGFIVQEKRGRKFVKLKGLPLTKKDALDKLAFRLDNKISRTARIKKIGKVRNLGSLRKREVGAFRRTRKNLREFRIVRGRKVRTPNQFIERKGRAVISTVGEKRQLRLNRLAKARSKRKKSVSRSPATKTRRIRTTINRLARRSPSSRGLKRDALGRFVARKKK